MNETEIIECDLLVVGAGPAGLAAAIKAKQLAKEQNGELSVLVIEKSSEIGAHILSGAVIDPVGLDSLLPDWREGDCPLKQKVTEDRFEYLTEKRAFAFPHLLMPPLLSNTGNYVGSLGLLCKWLGDRAEELEIDIFPGFSGARLIIEDGTVKGVVTSEMGRGKDGKPKANYQAGVEIRAAQTLLAEGARGSLTKVAIAEFGLDQTSDVPRFGIGLKELWQVEPSKARPGLVRHGFGWPLSSDAKGGFFLYHYGENLVSYGLVVHLDYANPYLSPFDEMQRAKHHPALHDVFDGGTRLAYGARAISEGGWQSIPRLDFPGGLLIGCAAGFVNVPRIKGSHNAILSGITAAEKCVANHFAVADQRATRLVGFDADIRSGAVGRDLKRVRNVKPLWSRFGNYLGLALGGFDMWCTSLFNFSFFGTLKHRKSDADCTARATDFAPRSPHSPDGKISFDKTSSIYLTDIAFDSDQPVHLLLGDPDIPVRVNLPEFAEPAQRYCPAGVYEIVEEDGKPVFKINAQNCIHCKTCDIKDPSKNITWTTPEGASGPNYAQM